MNKGRVVFLNGVTSSGKTAIVEVYCPPDICRERNIAGGPAGKPVAGAV